MRFERVYNKFKKMMFLITFFTCIALAVAIDVQFSDNFGGMQSISIPTCHAEPCDIVQGVPLITYLTFAAESPGWNQGKDFDIFTTGYLSTFMNGYGNSYGVSLTDDTDLTTYNPSFPLKPKQVSVATVPLVAPRIDPNIGPFPSIGLKSLNFLINVGNDTDFITVASASIVLNVIHHGL